MLIEAGQDRPFPDFPANERLCDFQRINIVVSASTFMLFDPVMLLVGFRKIREYRCHGASVEVRGQFVCVSSVPSTYIGDPIQVIGHGGRWLYPPSHLASLQACL